MGAKPKHKCSRIFPARTVPAPTILSRKDGAGRLPLAPVQTLDKVFSIPTLGSRSDDRIKPPLFPRSAEIGNLGGTSGYAEPGINHTILTAGGATLEGLCRLELPSRSRLTLGENPVQSRFHILFTFRP